jgi:hypothetical protein
VIIKFCMVHFFLKYDSNYKVLEPGVSKVSNHKNLILDVQSFGC